MPTCLRHDASHQLGEIQVRIGADHWLEGVARWPSPNCDERTDPDDIVLLVVHNISLPPGRFGGEHVRQFFTNCLDCRADASLSDLEGVRVSAHLFVDRRGEIAQFVPFDRRAWHAGLSSYRGRTGCNDFSIGIELEGTDEAAYEPDQYRVLADVVASLIRRYPALSLSGIVGHQEIAPGRKTDPGAAFDWLRLYRDCLERFGGAGGTHRR
jgi:N-acetyl-anhydromuramoyl-L-alanine amidase